MQTGPTGFAAALAAGTSPTITVQADVWGTTRDLAPMTSKIAITRELAGDLPDLASEVSGSIAAKATLDVDGFMTGAPNPLADADRIDWTSAPVRVQAGFAGLTVPVFTGTVREMSIDELSRQIKVSCLDGADLLRAPLTLPQFGSAGLSAQPGLVPARPTNLSAVVTAALHANGIRMTPAPRAGCLLSVPGVGGLLAEVGRTMPPYSVPSSFVRVEPSWIPGPFGPALSVNDGLLAYWAEIGTLVWNPGVGVSVEGWWNCVPPSSGAHEIFRINGAGGDPTFYLTLSGTTLTLTSDNWDTGFDVSTNLGTRTVTAGWHHVAFQLRYEGNYAMWVDGAAVSSGTAVFPVLIGGGTPLWIQVAANFASQALQIHGFAPGVAFDSAIGGATFAAQADVDQSVLNMDYVPIVAGRVSWDVLKEVAAAEGGAVGFNEAGRPFFRSAATLNATTTPVATIGTDIAKNLVGGTALAAVVSTVTAKVRPMTYRAAGLDRSGVWQAPCVLGQVLAFPPGTTSQIITAPRPVIIESHAVYLWTGGGMPASFVGYHMITLCTVADGSSGQITMSSPSIPTVSILQLSATTLLLTVVNLTGVNVYTVIPTGWAGALPWALQGGAPSLILSGWATPIDAEIPTVPVSATNDGTAYLYTPRTWELTESQWRQDPVGTATLVASLLDALSHPRLLLEDVETQWDPRWQLGDLVTVTDTAGRMPTQQARITRIDPTLALTEERRMTCKLGLRLIPPAAVTVATYDARWAASTAAYHDSQWAASRPGGVTAAQADALPLRVSP